MIYNCPVGVPVKDLSIEGFTAFNTYFVRIMY